MAFTVEDFQDLIRLLEAHPEWRTELRRHVLSDELLQMPEQMAALTARVEDLAVRMAELTARVDQLTARVEDLSVRMAELTARVDQLTARVDDLSVRMAELTARVDQLTARVDQLTEQVAALTRQMQEVVDAQRGMETRLGRVEGYVLQAEYARNGPAYFGRIARRLRLIDSSRLAELLDDALDAGALSWEERDDVLLADVVLRGRRRNDDADVYILAEVSAGIREEDIEKAINRARLLERLGLPVIPVVAGEHIRPEVAALARQRGAWQVLDGQTIPPALN